MDSLRKSKWARSDDGDDLDDDKVQRKKRRRSDKSETIVPSTSLQSLSATPPAESAEGLRASARADQNAVLRTQSLSPLSQNDISTYPLIASCRSVENYEKLNRIDEGAYGIVYRARDKLTGEIVALKKLKLENEKNGFPVTSLREIYTLLLCKHRNIVNVREIVVGESLTSVFIVMDFIEHDLKSLLTSMSSPFLSSEIKTLLQQLISAIALLHANWVVHRDLKTSNLLMNNRGEIKVADFGLARKFGEPLGNMTQLVVTLWYRAPELLLGAEEYSTEVDMWSIGCIFGELVNKEPLLPGKGELDQLDKIFTLLGQPTEKNWAGLSKLPHAKTINFNYSASSTLRARFPTLTQNGIDLLSRLLAYDPQQRISAEEALQHPYFSEHPPAKDPALFPTFPSKAGGEKKKVISPSAPMAFHGVGALDANDISKSDNIIEALLGGKDIAYATKNEGFRLRF